MNQKNIQQKGATSVLIVTFILSIILLVSLSAATIMSAEIKMSRQLTDSIPAFYAADSGAERCLYQARCADLGALATQECKDEVGSSLNQFCAKKTNGDQITSNTESLALANSPTYVAQRDQEQRVWSSGNFKGTKRSVEIEWDDAPACIPQCDGKRPCGEGGDTDECGGVCPATCNTLPGCRSYNPAGGTIVDASKTCCGGSTCYTCPAGFVWNAGMGQCQPDCAGVYNNTYCWYIAGYDQTCTSLCSTHGGINPNLTGWAVGSDVCAVADDLAGPTCQLTNSTLHLWPAWCPANSSWWYRESEGGGVPYVPNMDETSATCRKACACVR